MKQSAEQASSTGKTPVKKVLPSAPESILYVFFDGIGLGTADSSKNPFSKYADTFLRPLGGASSFKEPGYLVEADAHMGVPGLPQSATGQTALFTGHNGPAILGRHVNGFPTYTLRPYLQEHSIIKRFQDAGLKAGLLNSYSDWYLKRLNRPRAERLLSASSMMQMAAGLPFHTMEDYFAGRSLYMDITNWFLRSKFQMKIPLQPARETGRKAVRLARKFNLAVYEYFFSDKAGHAQSFGVARRFIPHMEGFLAGVWEEIDPEKELVIVSSDHGNLEDLSVKTHTENKVPVLLYGKGAGEMAKNIHFLYDIPREIYRLHGIKFEES